MLRKEKSFSQAIFEALREEMTRDNTVFIMGEDASYSVGGISKELYEEFGGERVRNTPICEAGFSGIGVGAALTGTRPVVNLYGGFVILAMDQVAHYASSYRYLHGGEGFKVPIVFRIMNSGSSGISPEKDKMLEGFEGFSAGGAQAISTESLFMHIPGIKIIVPSSPHDAKGLLKTAIRDDNPVLFYEEKPLYLTRGPVAEEEYLVPFGKAEIKTEGSDLSIVTYGHSTNLALRAKKDLLSYGVNVEVIDLKTLFPLDSGVVLNSVRKTGRLLTVEGGPTVCGVGAEIAALISENAWDSLRSPIKRVGMPFVPPPVMAYEQHAMVSY